MIDPSNYTGEKIELSSGQLLFNARSENIFLNSAKYISLSVGESIHFDIGPESTDNENNKFLVNAPRIEFKLVGKGRELTPVVRSQEMIEVIKNLLIDLNDYSNQIISSNELVMTIKNVNVAINKDGQTNIISVKLTFGLDSP